MEARALRLLIVAVAVALILLWVVRRTRNRPHVATTTTNILPPGANALLQGVTLLHHSPQGDLSLTSRSAEWSRTTNSFLLEEVDIRFLQGTGTGAGRAGHVHGERGEAAADGSSFSLDGPVLADTFDGYHLETADVRYDPDSGRVLTDAAVHLTGPGIDLSGRGATVDYE